MKHISRQQAEGAQNGAVTAWEYEMQDARLNVARIEVNGRYPESGFTRNLEVDAVVHIVDGAGIIGLIDGSATGLAKNDQVYIAKGEAYYFEGDMEILYAATPKWTPAQTEHVD